MAISALGVRDAVAPSYVRPARPVGGGEIGADRPDTPRRPPAAAAAGGLLAVLQALGLLAIGLTQADTLLASPVRPPGWVVAVGLVALAAWIVLSAGGGAALVDGSSRRPVVLTSAVELFAVSMLGVVALLVPFPAAWLGGVPLPLLLAVAVALPVTKLLLVDAASARRWVQHGPRVRARRPDPVVLHRSLCGLTLGVIALGLVGVTVLNPADTGSGSPAASVVSQP
ncbi:hypothetical protein [Blastococcus montanus]|uniref:hypothetical protein n=1 Tax=Blastococcus montanus TaxID=3144973 RepID=UPI003207CF51